MCMKTVDFYIQFWIYSRQFLFDRHFHQSVGGIDTKSHTQRILNKPFSNKFLMKCSWIDRVFEKKMFKFRIQNLQLISVMKYVWYYILFI